MFTLYANYDNVLGVNSSLNKLIKENQIALIFWYGVACTCTIGKGGGDLTQLIAFVRTPIGNIFKVLSAEEHC